MTIKRGFTLIELLIVIAIIGILAGVLITSLSGQRVKAYNANALTSLESAKSVAYSCVLGSTALAAPDADGGGAMCGNAADIWPTFQSTKWTYTPASFIASPTDATFTYVASSTDGPIITCTQAGCVKSGTGW